MMSKKETMIKTFKKAIYAASSRNERLDWQRKLKKLKVLRDELEPIEEKILQITREEKYPLMDNIEELRKKMCEKCIHPPEFLVVNGPLTVAECKFCGKKISTNRL